MKSDILVVSLAFEDDSSNKEPEKLPFEDVEEEQWYTDAVLWASCTGMATGYNGTRLFGTSDCIAREQMAVKQLKKIKKIKKNVVKNTGIV